ncbi:MAG: hypothetical protein U0835_24100 [Isosphaeraceae bacterium]
MLRCLKAFALAAIVVFFLGLLVAFLTSRTAGSRGGEDDGSGSQLRQTAHAGGGPDARGGALIDDLIKSGWTADAARAVAELNEEWFGIQREEDPVRYARQVELLCRLGRHPELGVFLTAHPEAAGLLAGVKDPAQIVASFPDSEPDYDLIAGCYVQNASPEDAARLAAALTRHRDVILDLRRRGLIGAEDIFIFDRVAPAEGPYDSWLREALEAHQQWSEDELSSFINLAMRHGPELRRRMREAPEFSSRYRGDLWPKMTRIASRDRNMFEKYLDDVRVWDLLALDQGEQLLDVSGLIAIDLLYGYREIGHDPYPESLRDRVVQILLRGDDRTIHALFRYRNEALFHKLIARPLTTDAQRAALGRLQQVGPGYPELLAKFDRLSDAALTEEVGPPPSGLIVWVPFYYTVYEVPKKLIQGRDPSAMDWFSAIADPAFLVIDIASGGESKVVRETVTKGGRTVVEKGAEKALVTTLKNTGLELAQKQLTKDVVESLGERELAGWTVTGTLSGMQQAVRDAMGRATTFEITKPVQFMFRYSGLGREGWKQLTGMEARLFMRGDARVFVRLSNVAGAVVGSRTAAYFERTAKDLTLGSVAESEPGQRTIEAGTRGVLSAKEQLVQWRRQASAWWLLNSTFSRGNTSN